MHMDDCRVQDLALGKLGIKFAPGRLDGYPEQRANCSRHLPARVACKDHYCNLHLLQDVFTERFRLEASLLFIDFVWGDIDISMHERIILDHRCIH